MVTVSSFWVPVVLSVYILTSFRVFCAAHSAKAQQTVKLRVYIFLIN